MFLFITISGIFLGIIKGSHGSQRAVPETMCLPTMTQAGREHGTKFIRLIHAYVLRIAPQMQTNTIPPGFYFGWKNVPQLLSVTSRQHKSRHFVTLINDI